MWSITLTGAAAQRAFEQFKSVYEDDERRRAEEEARRQQEMEQPDPRRVPKTWEYYIPVWGSALLSEQAWQEGQYFYSIGWFFMGVAEGLYGPMARK